MTFALIKLHIIYSINIDGNIKIYQPINKMLDYLFESCWLRVNLSFKKLDFKVFYIKFTTLNI